MTATSRIEVEALRRAYLAHGFQPIGVTTQGKVPLGKGWQFTRGLPDFSPEAMSTGLLCDGLRPADVDVDDPADCDAVVAIIENVLGPAGPIRERPDSPRVLLLYRAEEGEPKKRAIPLSCGKVEFLGWHNQALADGIHPDGQPYHWPNGSPDTVHLADVPAITEDQIDELEQRLKKRFPAPEPQPNGAQEEANPKLDPATHASPEPPRNGAHRGNGHDRGDAWARAALENECQRVASAPEGSRNDTLNKAALALGQIVAGGGLAESEVRFRLLNAALSCGLSRDEAKATILSGMRAGALEPRMAPEPMPKWGSGGGQHQAEKEEERYEILTMRQILAMEGTRFLVPGVIPAGEVSVLFGESNSFKSFLAIDMMCSVATGTPWHGHVIESPGPVVYIVSEGWKAAIQKRVLAWMLDHGIPEELWDRVNVIRVPVILNHADEVTKLLRTIKAAVPDAKFIVFDLLAGSMEGSEGDSECVTAWVRGAQEVAQHVTQLHVTHSGYSAAGRARGHSHLWGSFSTRLKAEGDPDARTVVLRVDRHKDEDSGKGWSFRLEQIPVGPGETSLVLRRNDGATPESEPKAPVGRRRDEKRDWNAKRFLQALDLEAEAAPVSAGFNGARVVKVHRDKIRDRMKSRGWLDLDDKGQISSTGRSEFSRARADAEAASHIVEENGMIWRVQ